MTEPEMLDRLDQRRRYLEKRARIKSEMGWEHRYEHEEAQSLAWALAKLQQANAYQRIVFGDGSQEQGGQG